MKMESVGQTAQSYSQFKDYLSQQAEKLDETLADARQDTKDVYVQSQTSSDHQKLGDVVVSKTTFARRGENLYLEVKKEEMIGYPISERSISFHKLDNDTFRVTDFDGENIKEMNIEA